MNLFILISSLSSNLLFKFAFLNQEEILLMRTGSSVIEWRSSFHSSSSSRSIIVTINSYILLDKSEFRVVILVTDTLIRGLHLQVLVSLV